MPTPCYLSLEGVKQGPIKGPDLVKGHEGKIQILTVEHSIKVPQSPQTGQPTGHRLHLPIMLTKQIDQASPKLFQALASGEQMKHVTLEYYRTSNDGKQEKYYTVVLSNAVLSSIRSWMPNCLLDENKLMGHMEDISFNYEKIVWTYEDGGITTQDDWTVPLGS